jgi:hypothetical protein
VLWLEDNLVDHPLKSTLVSNHIAFEVFSTVVESCIRLRRPLLPKYLIVDQAVPIAPGLDFPPPYGGLLFIAWARRRLDSLPVSMQASREELESFIGTKVAPKKLATVPVVVVSQYRSSILDALYAQVIGSQVTWLNGRTNPDLVVRLIMIHLGLPL